MLLVVPLLILLSSASSWGEAGPDRLGSLIARALAENPEVKTAEERLVMTEEKARQVGTFEDPMLMLKMQNGLVNRPLSFTDDGATAKVIGITQAIPFYGKRDLQRREADSDTEADRLRIEERKIELRRMVQETWFRISFVDRSLEVLEKNIQAVNDLLRFSETMYGVGKGLQQDVLRAQLERSKMEEMRITLEERRISLVATLNTLVYRPVETALPALPPVALTPLRWTQADLEELARQHRPLLKVQSALIDKSSTRRMLADREYFPDFAISLEYMQREQGATSEGDDMYSASLSFNLPVQHDRRQAMVAEAAAEHRMLVEEKKMFDNRIRQAVAESLAALDRNRRLAILYRDGILGQAAAVLETTIDSYQAGRTDFMKVLDSQMALFNLEREYHGAVTDYRMQVAVLEAIVGTELLDSEVE